MGRVVKDKDRGMARLIADLKRPGPKIAVGVFSDGPGREGGGPNNLEVATWNEFGTSRIPERSFIRATYDGERDRLEAAMRRVGELAVAGKDAVQLLTAFGQFAVGLIRKKISDGVPPPNAQSTIDRKGSSKPLVDTGQLRKAVTARVFK